MSTISEHLAELEMYAANGYGNNFASAAYLFTQVHWRDLMDLFPAAEIESARLQTEKRLRDQHGSAADAWIEKWQASRA